MALHTLHRPPVAIFIAQARQRQGCLHGTVKCVTFSFPQARHAAGIIIGTKDSSSLEDDDSDVSSEACERACFLDRLDVSGMSSGVVVHHLVLALTVFSPSSSSTSTIFGPSSLSTQSSMSEQTHEFYAGMTCDGCKSAITRIVTRIPGVSKLEVDVPSKRVLVTGSATKDEIEQKLSKWGQASQKEVRYVRTV